MRYTRERDNFAYVTHVDGRSIGFEFLNAEDQRKCEDLFITYPANSRSAKLDSLNAHNKFLEDINEDQTALYFICVLINRQEQTVSCAD